METCPNVIHSVTVVCKNSVRESSQMENQPVSFKFYSLFVDVPRENGSISFFPLEDDPLVRWGLKCNSPLKMFQGPPGSLLKRV